MLRSESDLVKNYVMSYHYEEDESFEGISKFKTSIFDVAHQTGFQWFRLPYDGVIRFII